MPSVLTNDIQTYYEIHGQGQPIVLIHGALVDNRMWQPQIGPFSAEHKVIVYDMRGHGQTGASSVSRYSTHLFVEDLHALITELEYAQFILCGLSLGGMIAQTYAAEHPERIKALILSDTAASATLTINDKLQTYLIGWSLPPTVRLLGARRFVDYALWLARLTRGEAWFGRDSQVRAYVSGCMRSFDTAEMAKVYDLIVGFRGAELARIQCPTLIINGEHESASVFHHSDHIRHAIQDAQAVVVPDAGHTSNMENPKGFNDIVLRFLLEEFDHSI